MAADTIEVRDYNVAPVKARQPGDPLPSESIRHSISRFS